MEQLWSMSTTLREAERVIGFAKTASEMSGEEWNRENQIKYQILLIKNRYYLSPDNTQSLNKLNSEQIRILTDVNYIMTYEEAESIFLAKEYEDPPMRGRQSMSPLKKLGLVYIEDNKIKITDLCWKLINSEISLEDFMFDSMLKYQYPNPMDSGYKGWNTKPFINTLRLIYRVNELVLSRGLDPKGITKLEFGIFVLSLKRYDEIDSVAHRILDFRELYNNMPSDEKDDFVLKYIDKYLIDFNNPIQNCFEYTDNMVRYLRLTKYIHLRGKFSNTYIDLEPRRMTEIKAILENDIGKAVSFTKEDWSKYIGTYGSYQLPFETIEILTNIAKTIVFEINDLESKLSIDKSDFKYPSSKSEMKKFIQKLRIERTELQNLEIKFDYHSNVNRIDEAIESLNYILSRNSSKLAKRFSIEFEKWTNVALNIINDAVFIKPNTIVGDDNEPIYTAPGGVADIECYYETFDSICEVTMLTGRDQWYNEGQPVMRHLRSFEISKKNIKDIYCLFIAPSLHIDTMNTFLMATKYQYDGKRQKIVPITIKQLIDLLNIAKECVLHHEPFKHQALKRFYEESSNLQNINTVEEWQKHIKIILESI